MKANIDATISADNICEFQEDILIPVQEDRLRSAVQGMANSCADKKTVDHVGAALIPSKDEIIRILNILKDVLFPGYFGRQELTHSTSGIPSGQRNDDPVRSAVRPDRQEYPP